MMDYSGFHEEARHVVAAGNRHLMADAQTIVDILDELSALRAAVPKVKKPAYTPEFLDAYDCMDRVGLKWRPGSTKPGAFACWKARITAGASAEEMHAGADKYARYCKATDRPVQMAQTFFGPQEFFSADWTIERPQHASLGKAGQATARAAQEWMEDQ